jgi:hypothetical protein
MRQPPGSRFKLAASSAVAGFVAGAATMAILVVIGERRVSPPPGDGAAQPAPELAQPATRTTQPDVSPSVSIEPT